MHLYVATRKGLLTYEGDGQNWEVVSRAFLGDPVSMVLPVGETIYAALNLGHFGSKVHRSDDHGANWQEISVPAYPELQDSDGKGDSGASLELIWALQSAGEDRPGSLWCGTIPGGLFFSGDRGESWELNQPLWDSEGRSSWFGGGYDNPGIHSICVDPVDSHKLTVGISCGGVHCTEDGGASWEVRGEGLWAEYLPPDLAGDPNQQDPHCLARCAANPSVIWMQHHNGIFVTRDECRSWQEIKGVRPSNFGFAVAVHPQDSDTAWFVPAIKDESRIPVDGKLVVTRTRDGGHSFQVLSRGLPQSESYDLVYRHSLNVDSSGNLLAMGSTTGNLFVSNDQGDSWQTLSNHLPPVLAVQFQG
jgi:hypothetical protein